MRSLTSDHGRAGEAGGSSGPLVMNAGAWRILVAGERTPMRRPSAGELLGWRPLAGELNQQRLQDQRQTLSRQEQIVMGLGSRDDAAAYLQQLRRTGADHGASQGTTCGDRPIDVRVP